MRSGDAEGLLVLALALYIKTTVALDIFYRGNIQYFYLTVNDQALFVTG